MILSLYMGGGNTYDVMFYNPLNSMHLYTYITQESSNCAFYNDSLRNTISLIDYTDTAHIKVTDKYIVTDSNEIFVPAFPQPNYNLGALKGSGCDTILSVTDTAPIGNAIKIYPNPTNYSVNIDMPYTGQCTIRDITGRVLENITLVQGKQNIPLDKYATGIYLLDMTMQNQRVVKKIVVQR